MIDTSTAADFTRWPMAAPPASGTLHMSANLSAVDIGTVMAMLLSHNLDDADTDPREIADLLEETA
jgi:hypothetical protein